MIEPLESRDTPFSSQCAAALEQVAVWAALIASLLILLTGPAARSLDYGWVLLAVGTLAALAVFFLLMAGRWEAEWLVYASEGALLGAYLYHQHARPLPAEVNALCMVLLCFLDLGVSQLMERLGLTVYQRPTLLFSLAMPLVTLGLALLQGNWDDAGVLLLFSTATFYGVACYETRWKGLGYVAAVLYDIALWTVWARIGWRLAEHPQLYLIPAGLSAILFAEANRRELDRQSLNAIRTIGSAVIYFSTALPMWQFQSFGAWLTLLLLSLVGIFAGIGLRVQSFLGLGLFCFVFDLLYQVGRLGMEDALAKWAIMLGLGILLILFVALNEKKRILLTMRELYEQVRRWE
jgi:hypothetical protein